MNRRSDAGFITWRVVTLLAAIAVGACVQRTEPADARPDAVDGDDAVTDAAAADARDAPDTQIVPYSGPDDWCPGSSHCTGAGNNRLSVGVATENINPVFVDTEWDDANSNGTLDTGETFTDTNHNGVFDGTWIAGFGAGRPARSVYHDLEARALVLRFNDVTVALVVIDAVGYFASDMDAVRAEPDLAGLDIDRVIVGATHCHECVDTVGMWGRRLFEDGKNPAYQRMTHTAAARAVRRAYESMRPARMRVAQTLTYDAATGSTMDYVNDTRDPVLYDPTLTIVRFVDDAAPANTIASWVNWSAHPEYSGSRNNQLTPDYVYNLRTYIEQGFPTESIPGLGGTTVFFNGALGGQVGPGGGVHPIGPDGVPIPDSGLPKAEAAGRNVARLALRAINAVTTDETDTSIEYRTAPMYARVANVGWCYAYMAGVFDRPMIGWDRTRGCNAANRPWVSSRVTFLRVGPVATITAPGELHPDLWVGYDSRWSWGQPVLTQTVNAPDLAMAPQPPYIRDMMLANPGVRFAFVSGLTEDFLGYIVPRFNFVLGSPAYIGEAEGDHYEETNSIGVDAEEHLAGPMRAIAQWRRP